MADNEYPGHGEPEGGSPPVGDFPADFFDGGGEPSPGSMTPGEPSPEDPKVPSPPPFPPRPPAVEPARPAAGAPSSHKAPEFVAPADEHSKMSPFPALMGLVMIGTLAAAWFVNKSQKEVAAAPTPAATTPAVVEPAPTPATTAITDALEGKVNGLAGKIDELSAQIKTVEGKINEQPKPAPAPDLKPLHGKLDDLSRTVASVTPLHDQVGKLGARFGSVDGELKSVKGELATLKDEVRKAAAAAAKPAAVEPKPAAVESASELTGGVDLFKAGKYKEADEVFKKLASGNPKDARVYYYAALTRGLTTNDWQGETLTTAAKGADLEKAGSTKATDVDAAFADLPPNLKPWLTFFRKQAK